MAKPEITLTELDEFIVVRVVIPGDVATPREFYEAVSEVTDRLAGDKTILINGRAPIWGHGMSVHAAHPTPAVATFDPRLGYVVVATHDGRFSVGQILADPEEE
jgi:CRISPR-associated protein Csx3